MIGHREPKPCEQAHVLATTQLAERQVPELLYGRLDCNCPVHLSTQHPSRIELSERLTATGVSLVNFVTALKRFRYPQWRRRAA